MRLELAENLTKSESFECGDWSPGEQQQSCSKICSAWKLRYRSFYLWEEEVCLDVTPDFILSADSLILFPVSEYFPYLLRACWVTLVLFSALDLIS